MELSVIAFQRWNIVSDGLLTVTSDIVSPFCCDGVCDTSQVVLGASSVVKGEANRPLEVVARFLQSTLSDSISRSSLQVYGSSLKLVVYCSER